MASVATFNVAAQLVLGSKRLNIVQVSLTSYDPTTGCAVSASNCGLSSLDFILPFLTGQSVAMGGMVGGPVTIIWDTSTSSLILIGASGVAVGAIDMVTGKEYITLIAIGA